MTIAGDSQRTILTGARPTGDLHIGHVGSIITPFVSKQAEFPHSVFVIADIHTLTTHADVVRPGELGANSLRLMAQVLASGVDPVRTHFVAQSRVAELGHVYSIVQSFVDSERVTEIESFQTMTAGRASISLGLVGYPILEAADTIALCATDVVVGEHNVSHVQFAQRIATRLNESFSADLAVPSYIAASSNLFGTDGALKMSKSLGNSINLMDDERTLREKLSRTALVDSADEWVPPKLLRALGLHDEAADAEEVVDHQIARDLLLDSMVGYFARFQSSVLDWESRPEDMVELLVSGAAFARSRGAETSARIRRAIGTV